MREWTIGHCLIANQAMVLLLRSAFTLSSAMRESGVEGKAWPFFRAPGMSLPGLGGGQRQGLRAPAGAAVA